MRGFLYRVVLLVAACFLYTASQAQVVVHEIPAPSGDATGLCWDGSALWVSDYSANVYKVNPSTGAVLRTLTGPVAGSRGLAYADGHLWTVSRATGDRRVFKIDTTTGAVVTQIADPTNGYAGGVAWDGTTLWFSVYYPVARMLRVSPSSGDTLAMFNAPGAKPWGLAFDGAYLWNSSEENSSNGPDSIYWLDAATGAKLWSFVLPPHTPLPAGRRPRGLAWDGQYLWVLAYEVNGWNIKIFKYDVSNAVNPDIHLAESRHDFGSRVVGYPLDWSVNVTNVGNVNLVIDSARFISGAAYRLVAPAVFPATVAPAGTTAFTVRFDPPAAGMFLDTLRIYSNDPDEGVSLVALRGIGLADEGDIDPQPAVIDFGPVRVSNPLLSTSRTLRLFNAGAGRLHVSNLEIIGDTAFTMDAVSLPAAVDSYAHTNVRVWFNPRRTIPYSATLRIQSDDPDEPVVDVPLMGIGDGSAASAGDVLWYLETGGTSYDRNINSVQWIADVNGDGIADALAAAGNSLVYCLNGSSSVLGDTLWTFNLRISPDLGGYVYYERGMCTTPDITGDGIEDVIVGTSLGGRSVHALSGVDGTRLWTFDTRLWGTGGTVYEVASADGDLNGDLVPDVLGAVSSDASRVFAVSGANGQLLWAGPQLATFYTVRPIHDVTGDNVPEAVGGTTDGRVAAYNGATGATLWTVYVSSGSPVFALLPMGNANPEVTISEDVVAAGAYTGVYCLDGNNGARIWTRGESGAGVSVYRLAVGSDITGDNVREVCYATQALSGGGGWVRCLDGSSGQLIWETIADPFSTANVWGLVSVPDVTGDAIREIACGTQGNHVVLLDGWDGTRIWATPGNSSSPVDATSPMPDIDHSGSWDVLTGHRDGVVQVIAGSDGVYIPPEESTGPESGLLSRFALHAAYPNPFNATATISYELPRESEVRLKVFDCLGRHVVTLMDAVQGAGTHTVVWSGENRTGAAAGSGVYFVQLQCESFRQVRKLVLLK